MQITFYYALEFFLISIMLRQSLRVVYVTPGWKFSNSNAGVLYLTVITSDEEIIMVMPSG